MHSEFTYRNIEVTTHGHYPRLRLQPDQPGYPPMAIPKSGSILEACTKAPTTKSLMLVIQSLHHFCSFEEEPTTTGYRIYQHQHWTHKSHFPQALLPLIMEGTACSPSLSKAPLWIFNSFRYFDHSTSTIPD